VWVAAPEGPDWRTNDGTRRCRASAGYRHPACGQPAVAEFNRRRNRYKPPFGTADSWWAYCGEHLFGRWVQDDRVMRWVLRLGATP
jgi:hypothetical protein